MYYEAVLVKHELINSVGVNANKTKGILVFAQERYLSVFGHKTFILVVTFSL